MPSHFLQRSRHGTVFFFRRRIPDDLQTVLGHKQLYRSLGTTCRRTAVRLARALASQSDTIFETLRMSRKSDKPISAKLSLDYVMPSGAKLKVSTTPDDPIEVRHELLRLAERLSVEAHEHLDPAGSLQVAEPMLGEVAAGKTLKQAVDEYLADVELKPRTIKSYRTALADHAVPFFGEGTSLAAITQAKFAGYVRHLRGLPGYSPSSIEGFAHAVTGMCKWHHGRGMKLPSLTTATLLARRMQPGEAEWDAFTLDDLRVVFENARSHLPKAPWKYWVTVVTAMTGCRVEELCQVNLITDLHQDPGNGRWHLSLNEAPDADGTVRKSLKRMSSWRVMPIHSGLVARGFITYLQAQLAKGHTRPFEDGDSAWTDPKTNSVKWSHGISKWGGRELTKLAAAGLISREARTLSYFRSMRHTMANTLGRQGVSEEYRSAIQGQQFGGINASRYAKLRLDYRLLGQVLEENLGEIAALL